MSGAHSEQYLTTTEIAALELPGLPATRQGMDRHAATNRWDSEPAYFRARKGKGGGREYSVRLLPAMAQAALKARDIAVMSGQEAFEANAALSLPLSQKAAQNRDARLAIVAAYMRYQTGLHASANALMTLFTRRYNAGEIDCDSWIVATLPKLSVQSLQRWVMAKNSGSTDCLAVDRAQARAGTGVIETAEDGKLKAHILGLIAQQPHLSAHHLHKLCRAEFGDVVTHRGRKTVMPPVRTFQHCVKVLKAANSVALVKITNPDQYRSTLQLSGTGALQYVTTPNSLWQIDASPADALCVDGRHSIYACIDIATRRVIISVSRTPRAAAVMLLVRKAILAWGVPNRIKTDNGSDFTARDTKRMFDALGVELELSDAYSPQQKGHVERVIRTFQHDCGTLLPGFVGHNVADRKAIESRKSFADRLGTNDADMFGVSLTGADLQGHVDEWAMLSYGNRPHGSLEGLSPNNAALKCGYTPRMVTPRALDVLLMAVPGKDGLRTVTKMGLRIADRHYLVPQVLPGETVMVRLDPADMGRAYVFDASGTAYLGEAICPELAGVDPQALVAAAKEMHRAKMDEATRDIRAEMKRIAKGPSLIERALSVDRRDAPNVVALPRKAASHSTPQLDAANAVVLEADYGQPKQPIETATIIALARPDTDMDRFKRALELKAKVEDGRGLSVAEGAWLAGYTAGPEYSSLARMAADFPDFLSDFIPVTG